MPTASKDEPANVPELLPTALLLAATGGLLDAVTYMNHGHVFANAMTGNTIFLGISMLTRDWIGVLQHTVPLVAFFAGIVTSKFMRARLGLAARPVGIALEIGTLAVMGALPAGFPEMLFVAMVAFASSLQMASFRHVGAFSYNSTFLTGNLRDAAEGLYDALAPGATDRAARRTALSKACELGLICLCFLVGAMVGAMAAPRLRNHSYWLPEPLLLMVLAGLLWADARLRRAAR
jgi:uncharacterized membrane protein YoaK (UPF0700 family)